MEAPNVLKVETFELWETIKTRYISNTLQGLRIFGGFKLLQGIMKLFGGLQNMW